MTFKTVASTSKSIVDVSDAFSITLSNEAVTLACDSSGNLLAGQLGSTGVTVTTITAYQGTNLLTAVPTSSTPAVNQFKYDITNSVGCTAQRKDDSSFYLSVVSADSGSVTITVTLNDSVTIVKTFTFSKSYQGSAGKGVSTVTEYYLATSSSSGVTTATSGWTTTVQTISSTNKYLWNYEKVTYSDNSTNTTTPTIIGVYGDTGGTGSAGKGVSSVTEYYLATSSSSGVTTATAGWTTTVQSLTTTNKYLWNYEKVTYTDSSTNTTTPVIIGVYGDTGNAGNDAVTAVLNNEVTTLPSDNSGNVLSYTGASSTMTIFKGTVDDSANWTVTTAVSNVTGSLSGKTYTVTGLSADSGYVDFTATRSGYPNITKRFTLVKSKAGLNSSIGYSTNPFFTTWGATSPTGFTPYTTNPTQDLINTRHGGIGCRFNVAAGVASGINSNGAGSGFAFGIVPELSYYQIEFDVYINSATSLQGAGLLVDFVGLKADGVTVGYDRVYVKLADEIPTYKTGNWYQVRKALPLTKVNYTTFQYLRIYVMGNYSGLGTTDAKDITFDYVNVLSIPLKLDKLSAITSDLGTVNAGTINGAVMNGNTINLVDNGTLTAKTTLGVGTSLYINQGDMRGFIGGQDAFYGWYDGDVDSFKGFNGNISLGWVKLISANGTLDGGITESGLGKLAVGGFQANSGAVIVGTSTGNANTSWLGFFESDGSTRTGWVGDGGINDSNISLYSERGSSRIAVSGHALSLLQSGALQLDGNDVDIIYDSAIGAAAGANGGYIRYNNGIQIAWNRWNITTQAISSAYGSLFQGTKTWTFPISFYAAPVVQCSEFKWGTSASWGTVAGPASATSVDLRGMDIASRATGTSTIISAIAIGTWK